MVDADLRLDLYHFFPEVEFIGASSNINIISGNALDSNTRIFLCSDATYLATVYCKVHSFAIWYSSHPFDWKFYRAGLSRNFSLW